MNDNSKSTKIVLYLSAGYMVFLGTIGGGPIILFCGLLLLFIIFITFFISRDIATHLTVKRVTPESASTEMAISSMTLKVENLSPFICIASTVIDNFPPGGHAEQVMQVGTPLMPGRTYEIPLQFQCRSRRGSYTIGPLKYLVSDHLGLFGLQRGDSSRKEFYIYPDSFDMPNYDSHSRTYFRSFGEYNTMKAGHGWDFLGLNEYRPGDDSRNICWSASARATHLMVREYEHAATAKHTILFDLNTSSLCGLGHHTTAEYAIKITASLCQTAIGRGDHVQLLASGKTEIDLAFNSGLRQLNFIMHELIVAKAAGEKPLYELLAENMHRIPAASDLTIVFSKCDINVQRYLDLFNVLRASRVNITAIIIDHTTFVSLYEMHKLESTEMAHSTLMHMGITTYIVNRGDDFVEALTIPLSITEEIRAAI